MNEILTKARHNCKVNEEKIREAIKFSKKKHQGQNRLTGEKYWKHPAQVTLNVIEYQCDTETICAALLHDVIEDTTATLEDIKEKFGEEIKFLVDGMSEDKNIQDKKERKIKYHEKIKRYGEEDKRIYYIKFADILHNIKTIKVKGKQAAERYISEVKNFYLPIAEKMNEEIAEELKYWCENALNITVT